jgi:hypothetical protein
VPLFQCLLKLTILQNRSDLIRALLESASLEPSSSKDRFRQTKLTFGGQPGTKMRKLVMGMLGLYFLMSNMHLF